MKANDTKGLSFNGLLGRLLARQFAKPSRAAKKPKASTVRQSAIAPQVTPARQITKAVVAKPDRAKSRKQERHQPAATTVRKITTKLEPATCFADLLKEMGEGSQPMAVEGWEHRTRDGGYVNTPKQDASKLPCRVEGFEHRARDGSKLP